MYKKLLYEASREPHNKSGLQNQTWLIPALESCGDLGKCLSFSEPFLICKIE